MEARVARQPLLILMGLVLLIRLPFLNQAIQGDDHIYITEAQHALIDPLHPSYVKYVFLGDEVDLRGHSHPPGNAWPLAGLLLVFGDVREIPFHAIVLTSAHWNYRVPNANDLRLQVYGAIAYGAKGIGYYKFCSEPLSVLNAPDLGNFRMAPLDEFGEKTRVWEDLRNVNRQVLNIAPTLLRLRSDDVYHIGEVPERNHGVTDASLVTGLEAGTAFIIGDFTHDDDGSRWVMIVNKNLKESAFCRPKFRTTPTSVRYVSPVTGELKTFPSPWYSLAPGQAVLLRLN